MSRIPAWDTKRKTRKESYWYDREQHRKIKTVELGIDEDVRYPDGHLFLLLETLEGVQSSR